MRTTLKFNSNLEPLSDYMTRITNILRAIRDNVPAADRIDTMDASLELLFTILSSLTQEESRNISENCKWAIRHNFQKGKPTINTKMFMGYDKDENGKLIINKEQAKIVKRIYKLFEEGYNCSQISSILKREGVKGTKADT